MRLSVVSVVSFQGFFGVEVRMYKVFENKYLVAAREDFSQNLTLYVREDLVNTFAPAT